MRLRQTGFLGAASDQPPLGWGWQGRGAGVPVWDRPPPPRAVAKRRMKNIQMPTKISAGTIQESRVPMTLLSVTLVKVTS